MLSLEEKAEILEAGARDPLYWCRAVLPETFRQDSPEFHREMWKALLLPGHRYVAMWVFRDGGKTTLLRAYALYRAVYGLTNTCLYIGATGDKANRSLKWLRGKVERNRFLCELHGIQPGQPWTDEELKIERVDGSSFTLIGSGVEGSLRGLNVEDWRPSLIVLDDVVSEVNSKTPESMNQLWKLISGGIADSLAPETEVPDAKLVMINTPIMKGDPSDKAMNDVGWLGLRYGIWTTESEGLPLNERKSRWEARWPADVMRRERGHAAARNLLSVFAKEKECRFIADEAMYFSMEWLSFWTSRDALPQGMVVVAGIDPSPPKAEEPEKRAKKDPDPEVVAAVGGFGAQRYVLETIISNDPDPARTWQNLLELKLKWRVSAVGVETVAYQATLAWYIREQMRQRKIFMPVIEIKHGKVPKTKRIRQRFVNLCSNGGLHVHESHDLFLQQYRDFPAVTNDDVIDAVEIACTTLDQLAPAGEEGTVGDYEVSPPSDVSFLGAP